MGLFRRGSAVGLLLLAWGVLAGCRASDDAVAASEQMKATAFALQGFYAALASTEAETVALLEVDSAIKAIPFSADDRKLPDATRAELLERRQMAERLGALAAALGALTESTAATKVQTAATAMGNALIRANALPAGSPIPDSVGSAGRLLLQVVQEGNEKRVARAMDETLLAITQLFEQEQPAYASLTSFHLRQASQMAQDLANANGVDVASMLVPALQPFGLAPLPASPELQERLHTLALQRLEGKVTEGTSREAEASAAMLAGLQEMNARVHALATGHHLAVRSEPFTLHTVEDWSNRPHGDSTGAEKGLVR